MKVTYCWPGAFSFVERAWLQDLLCVSLAATNWIVYLFIISEGKSKSEQGQKSKLCFIFKLALFHVQILSKYEFLLYFYDSSKVHELYFDDW